MKPQYTIEAQLIALIIASHMLLAEAQNATTTTPPSSSSSADPYAWSLPTVLTIVGFLVGLALAAGYFYCGTYKPTRKTRQDRNEKQLLEAAASNDFDRVAEIIRDHHTKINVRATDADGNSFFHYLAFHEHDLERSSGHFLNVDVYTRENQTIKNKQGETPFLYALHHNKVFTIRYYIATLALGRITLVNFIKFVDGRNKLLHALAKHFVHQGLTAELITRLDIVNNLNDFSENDEHDHNTPLHTALSVNNSTFTSAVLNDISLKDALLQHCRPALTSRNLKGQTLLHLALENDDIDLDYFEKLCVQLFLQVYMNDNPGSQQTVEAICREIKLKNSKNEFCLAKVEYIKSQYPALHTEAQTLVIASPPVSTVIHFEDTPLQGGIAGSHPTARALFTDFEEEAIRPEILSGSQIVFFRSPKPYKAELSSYQSPTDPLSDDSLWEESEIRYV